MDRSENARGYVVSNTERQALAQLLSRRTPLLILGLTSAAGPQKEHKDGKFDHVIERFDELIGRFA